MDSGLDTFMGPFVAERVAKPVGIRMVEGGFPHSEILGSKLVRSSPRLIAAYHVLHRLSAPRHPPNALKALDHSHDRCPPSEDGNHRQKDHCSWTTFRQSRTYACQPGSRSTRRLRAMAGQRGMWIPASRTWFLFTISNIRVSPHGGDRRESP